MSTRRYFCNVKRTSMVECDTEDFAQRFINRPGWMEVSEEEFDFIDTHTPDDPEWIARYGENSEGAEQT